MTTTILNLPVVTYNAGNASDRRVLLDLHRLARETKVDGQLPVILLQEVADRAFILDRFARDLGYVLHQETVDDKGHVAVLVPPLPAGAHIKARGYWRCTKRTPVGAWGAGPSTIAAKWVAWVTLEDVEGRTITVASTHFVPSVQRPAHTGPAIAARARRLALYVRHVTAILAFLVAHRGAKILGADWNATPGFPLLRRLSRLVLRTAPSHGKRAIDVLRSTRRRWLEPGPARALNGYSSDHKPVAVTYRVKAKRSRRRKS